MYDSVSILSIRTALNSPSITSFIVTRFALMFTVISARYYRHKNPIDRKPVYNTSASL
jgi:hypothetical protein